MGNTACATAAGPISPHLMRNYVAHSLDGGLYMGALTLVSATTVLPAMVRDLRGPNWLISFMPIMMMLGVMLPPIFTAHLLDRLQRFKPVCIITGVFQRLPYLVAGLVLVYWADGSPRLALATVALAPLVSGIVAGTSFTGWQQLVAMIHESPESLDRREQRRGLTQNLRAMPGILRSDRRLALFILMKIAANGVMIMVPFLAIHARQTLGEGESFVGDLTVANMAGALLGNALAGFLGDRFGGKIVLAVSRVGFLIVAAGSVFAASEMAFLLIFVVFGFSFYSNQIGGQVLSLEVCPKERRSTALAAMSFVNLPSLLLATGVSAVVSTCGGSFAYLAALAGCSVAASLAFLLLIEEPRRSAVP